MPEVLSSTPSVKPQRSNGANSNESATTVQMNPLVAAHESSSSDCGVDLQRKASDEGFPSNNNKGGDMRATGEKAEKAVKEWKSKVLWNRVRSHIKEKRVPFRRVIDEIKHTRGIPPLLFSIYALSVFALACYLGGGSSGARVKADVTNFLLRDFDDDALQSSPAVQNALRETLGRLFDPTGKIRETFPDTINKGKLSPFCEKGETYSGPKDHKCHLNYGSWSDAKKYCKENDATLPIIRDFYMNSETFIRCNNSLMDGCWLGLSDLEKEDNWKWEDNTTLGFSDYSNWKAGEPNNQHREGENCAEFAGGLLDGSEWNDAECSARKKIICSKPVSKTAAMTYFPHRTDGGGLVQLFLDFEAEQQKQQQGPVTNDRSPYKLVGEWDVDPDVDPTTADPASIKNGSMCWQRNSQSSLSFSHPSALSMNMSDEFTWETMVKLQQSQSSSVLISQIGPESHTTLSINPGQDNSSFIARFQLNTIYEHENLHR